MAAITPGADFKLTPKQRLARKIASGAQHFMAFGGSRSGKTFFLVRAIIIRALRASGSSHVILRHRLNHLRDSIIGQTIPTVLRVCFPQLLDSWNAAPITSQWTWTLPNGSRIMFGGLDDAQRTEKILGQEHATIYLNECSQISYGSRNKAVTRLAQLVPVDLVGDPHYGQPLALRMFYDCNPPPQGHWTHLLFIKKVEPLSRRKLANPDDYAAAKLNPADNLDNLAPGYLDTLDQLPERDRLRFKEGEFLAQVDNALWTYTLLETRRADPRQFDGLGRTVIGVDPSGTSGDEEKRSDLVGIVAAGKSWGGQGLILEDQSTNQGPQGWALEVCRLFDKWEADSIVAEANYGGAMVESTIRAVRPSLPVRLVTASRGKHIRAEPISTLYHQNKVLHAGDFPELEEELVWFSTSGYQGARSPNRADAAIWALTDLMLGDATLDLGNVG